MSRFLKIVSRLFAVAFAGYIGWLFFSAYHSPEAVAQRTEALLSDTKFDRFEFREVTLMEAVEVYRRALQAAGIRPHQVQVRIMPGVKQNRRAEGEAHPPRHSLKLSDIPAIDAGQSIASLFDLKFSVVEREARIHTEEESPLIHRTIKIDPQFSPQSLPLVSESTYDLRSLLEPHGVKFPNGAWATYRQGSGNLEVFLREKDINLVGALFFGWSVRSLTWQERLKGWLGL